MAPTPDERNEDRIAVLEEHVAHQARTIEDLSDQLAEQWKTVEQLTERFLSLEEQALDAPAITRPPHY